jgi:hypothetical protein
MNPKKSVENVGWLTYKFMCDLKPSKNHVDCRRLRTNFSAQFKRLVFATFNFQPSRVATNFGKMISGKNNAPLSSRMRKSTIDSSDNFALGHTVGKIK